MMGFGEFEKWSSSETGALDVLGGLLGPIGSMVGAVTGGGGKPSEGGAAASGPGGMLSSVVGGVTGGGGAGGALASVPGQNLIQPLSGAIGQTQGTPAPTVAGSTMGMGLGLPFGGTGPLPDPMSQLAARHFAHMQGPMGMMGGMGGMLPGMPGQMSLAPAGLPPISAVSQDPAARAAWQELATHGERVGRAVVQRIFNLTAPELDEIRALLRERAAQIQATAEHKAIVDDSEFKASVIRYLLQLRERFNVTDQPRPLVQRPPQVLRAPQVLRMPNVRIAMSRY